MASNTWMQNLTTKQPSNQASVNERVSYVHHKRKVLKDKRDKLIQLAVQIYEQRLADNKRDNCA